MTTQKDERTVARGPATGGASGGVAEALEESTADTLPAGTRLGEFEITRPIGVGGFGIVYLAHDHSLDREVAIKEYMPASLAARTRALDVSVRSERHADTFAAGLRSFINEARLLARFDHPSLLKVYRFWEAHGTAYMAMPYYEGETLGAALKRLGEPPDEAWLRQLLAPLLDALEQMHAAHCFHRDISPDNILILRDGRPLLLDFGAARRVIGDMTRAPTVILKTGYAPVEQYGDVAGLTQGAWTDLYALASVMHFAILRRTPPQAVARYLSDKYEPLVKAAAGRYGERFLRAIDAALAVRPKDRPQSAAAWRAQLGSADVTPATVAPAAVRADRASGQHGGAASASGWAAPRDATTDSAASRRSETTAAPNAWREPASLATATPSAEARRRRWALAAAGAAACAVAAALWIGLASDRRGALPTSADLPTAATPATRVPEEAPARRDDAAIPAPSAATEATPATPVVPVPDAGAQATAPAAPATPLPTEPTGAGPPRRAAAATPAPTPPRLPGNTPSSRRCIEILERVTLGEPLLPEDKDFMSKECR